MGSSCHWRGRAAPGMDGTGEPARARGLVCRLPGCCRDRLPGRGRVLPGGCDREWEMEAEVAVGLSAGSHLPRCEPAEDISPVVTCTATQVCLSG